jgi:hypothetical protein
MTTTLTPRVPTPPRPRTGIRLRLAPIGEGRWRVVDPTGLIIGHIDARPDPSGVRYRARRYHPGARAFVELGAFWSVDDAVDCLRYSR